jgi:2-oxoglutarate ferredoxin oxidoreductase subunit delta
MQGTVTIDTTLCKGCALCIPACPKGLLRIDTATFNARGVHPVSLEDPNEACSGCEMCAVLCPEAAITVYRRARA